MSSVLLWFRFGGLRHLLVTRIYAGLNHRTGSSSGLLEKHDGAEGSPTSNLQFKSHCKQKQIYFQLLDTTKNIHVTHIFFYFLCQRLHSGAFKNGLYTRTHGPPLVFSRPAASFADYKLKVSTTQTLLQIIHLTPLKQCRA